MDKRFPLLKLPERARQRVVKVMDSHEIFGFSLISEECKKLAISIKIKGHYMSVGVGNQISISFWTICGSIILDFYTESHLHWIMETGGQKKTLKPPESVIVNLFLLHRNNLKWENKKAFGMKEWLEHIQTVFDCHKIDTGIFQQNAFRFNIDYVKETFGKINYLTVRHSGSYENNVSILEMFFPIERLSIDANAFVDSKVPPRILMQNFASLFISYHGLQCVSLDDLLMINSTFIHISTFQAPLKMLNKFVKLWKQGAHPRMERFQILYGDGSETDINEILKGIVHDEVRQERPRPNMLADREFNTYRIDGMKATIRFEFWNNDEGVAQFGLLL